ARRRRDTRSKRDWSADVCASDLPGVVAELVDHDGHLDTVPLDDLMDTLRAGGLQMAVVVDERDGVRYEGRRAHHGLDGGGGALKIGRASCRGRASDAEGARRRAT